MPSLSERSFRRASVIAPALLLAACVHVNKSVLTYQYDQRPVPLGEVYVFLYEDILPEDCDRVALLHASGPNDWATEGDMVDRLREEAGKLGANAIQLRSMEEPGAGERIADALFGTGSDKDAEAVAYFCPGG